MPKENTKNTGDETKQNDEEPKQKMSKMKPGDYIIHVLV